MSKQRLRNQRPLRRNGYVGLYADDAVKLRRLDRLARDCVGAPGIEEWEVPSLIDEQDLVKCGYISAFPSQLTVAATVAPNAYPGVVKARAVGRADLEHRGRHLIPAACLNLYPMLAASPPCGNGAVTALATVFRHEEAGFEDPFRLWEFKVREFVFVGERAFVTERLERALAGALTLAKRLELRASAVAASDHFYPSLENRVKQRMQIQGVLKHELVASIGDKQVALASFNAHDTHFSRAYGFDAENSVVTGCVGFGLHRWLVACGDAQEHLAAESAVRIGQEDSLP